MSEVDLFISEAVKNLKCAAGGQESLYGPTVKALKDTIALKTKSDDLTTAWLRDIRDRIQRAPGRSHGGHQIAALVKTMLDTGRHGDDPFFDWCALHIDALLRSQRGENWLYTALENDMWSRMLPLEYDGYQGKKAYRLITFDFPEGFCRDLLEEYISILTRPYLVASSTFFQWFSTSLGQVPASLDDFTAEGLDRQVRWFDSHITASREKAEAFRHIARFYLFVINHLPDDQDTFSYRTGVTKGFLARVDFAGLWLEGFRSVIYNPLDPPPGNPRWMLSPNTEEREKSSYGSGAPQLLDLSVPDPALQELLIRWVWQPSIPSQTRRRAPAVIKDFLLHRLSPTGKTVPLHTPSGIRISYQEVSRFLDSKRGIWGDAALRHYRGWISSFLRFGQELSALDVEPAALMLLDQRPRGTTGTSTTIGAATKEDMGKLANELDRRSSESIEDLVVYTVFCMQSLTPLRIGEILTLRRKQISDGPRNGIHVIARATKTTGLDHRGRIQLQPKLYRLLAEVMERTAEMIPSALAESKDCIFLIHGVFGTARCADQRWYRTKTDEACTALGISRIAPQNIRKRYMTEVIEQSVKQHISRFLTKPLTGHTSLGSDRAYLREDERLYLEALYGIEIGMPKIKGTIGRKLDPDIDPHRDKVQEGTGYCRNVRCDVSGNLPCWLCPFFYTTPDNLPEMRQAADNLRRTIGSGNGVHDDDHYRSVLKLVLAYIAKMIEAQGDPVDAI